MDWVAFLLAVYEKEGHQLTPRDLSMMALLWIIDKKDKSIDLNEAAILQNGDFILTASRKKISEKNNHLINLHEFRENLTMSEKKAITQGGLNAHVIIGPPGTGKTKLVLSDFEKKGYSQRSLYPVEQEEKKDIRDDKIYYYLDSDTPIELGKNILYQAFHEGTPVVIEEFGSGKNSYADELNAYLSGVDLTDEPPRRPGFIAILLRNGSELPGRARLTPDQKARMIITHVDHYTAEECWEIFSKNTQLDLQSKEKEQWIAVFNWYWTHS
jgi:hypothetical protein